MLPVIHAMLNKKRPLKKSSTVLITQILGMITQIYYRVFRQSQKGLTLIEVLISLVITLVLFMALMQSALLSISSNTKNILRDEAVSIAEERMRELRGLPFDHVDLNAVIDQDDGFRDRDFRNFTHPFNRTLTVTDLDGNTKEISVEIMWEWQENTVANLNELKHTITSIKRRL